MRERALVLLVAGACASGDPFEVEDAGPASGTDAAPMTPPDARVPDPTPPTTFIGAGDIAKCSALGLAGLVRDPHDLTSDQILSYPSATPVFTIGDNVYSDGSALEFATCYSKSWGRFRDRTNPTPGNHDYNTDHASPYYEYFGSRAGDPLKGYYAYNVGAWRVLVLNSNCGEVACSDTSPQLAWLRAELATTSQCTMAMWHHPRFSSDRSGTNDGVRPFYQALYEANADLILVGHAHSYERFAPTDADGNIDMVRGIRQFVVGTGGADLRPEEVDQPASELFLEEFGIMELSLYADRYAWKFVPTEGSVNETGETYCH